MSSKARRIDVSPPNIKDTSQGHDLYMCAFFVKKIKSRRTKLVFRRFFDSFFDSFLCQIDTGRRGLYDDGAASTEHQRLAKADRTRRSKTISIHTSTLVIIIGNTYVNRHRSSNTPSPRRPPPRARRRSNRPSV